jgi:hypothetical protein
MALGFKTGGRKAGTPNKRSVEVAARLEELGVDPVAGMAALAVDPQVPVEVRARMFSELAQYVAPKRKAVDFGSQNGQKVLINLAIPARDPQVRDRDFGVDDAV